MSTAPYRIPWDAGPVALTHYDQAQQKGGTDVQDAWRAYMELALGVTEASRRKAERVAKKLVGKGGAKAAQLQAFAEDLVSTSRANREGLVKLVRYEVDRALGAVGLATAEDMVDLRSRVRDLEREMRQALARSAAAEAAAATAELPPPPADSEAVAKKIAAVEAPAPTSTPKQAAAKKTAARKAATKKAVPAKTTPARPRSGHE